jgi:hypothetical protein
MIRDPGGDGWRGAQRLMEMLMMSSSLAAPQSLGTATLRCHQGSELLKMRNEQFALS